MAKPAAKSWKDFVSGQPAKPVTTGGGPTSARSMRMDWSWRKLADPGEALRDPKIPSVDYEPITMRFVPLGDGSFFFNYYAAWVPVAGSKRLVVSNAHNGQRGDYPCLLYAKMLQDSNSPSVYEARQNSVALVELLEDFHIVQEQRGNYKGSHWHRCTRGNGSLPCSHCATGNTVLFGRRVMWDMYTSHSNELNRHFLEIQGSCANCGDGTLSVEAWSCPNCGAVYCDNASQDHTQHVDPEAEAVYMSSPVECDACGATNWAAPRYTCAKITGFGRSRRLVAGCDNPTVLPIENAIITLGAEKNGKTTRFSVIQYANIDAVELPTTTGFEHCPELDVVKLWDCMSIAEQAKTLGLDEAAVKELCGGMSIAALDAELTAIRSADAPEHAEWS